MLPQFPSRLMWVACVAALSAWCGPSVEAAPAAPACPSSIAPPPPPVPATSTKRSPPPREVVRGRLLRAVFRPEPRGVPEPARRRALPRAAQPAAPEPRANRGSPSSRPAKPRSAAVRRARARARTGAAVPRAYVYVYQTDHTGYYDRDPGGPERGPENARVFGIARADGQGRVEVHTIVPGSYPGGGFRHIHYFIRADGYEDTMREVILDEEPRPSRQQKEWAVRNGDVVARRSMGRASTLDVVLPVRRKG